jgi:hypothetical protein
VEPLFAEAKDWHGLRRFRLRGLANVNIAGLLIAAGQNLKRFLAATGDGLGPAPCSMWESGGPANAAPAAGDRLPLIGGPTKDQPRHPCRLGYARLFSTRWSFMIPPFDPSGNLPPGVYPATWEEVIKRFGGGLRRQRLIAGFELAMTDLRAAGCRTIYLDGSLVTGKARPGDFDACWDTEGVDWDRIDPVLTTFADARRAQKAKYGGEIFPADAIADIYGTRFLDFFQTDKHSLARKGIVAMT